jgi:hypothetical protein
VDILTGDYYYLEPAKKLLANLRVE